MNRFNNYLLRIKLHELTNYLQPRFKLEALDDETLEKKLSFNQLLTRLRFPQAETYFIHSPAGSGKTSLIWQLMINLLSDESQTACIRVSVQSLKQYSGQPANEYIRALCPNTVDIDLWKSHTKKNKPKIIIFIDALNEIHTAYKDTDRWEFILNLLEGNHRFCVVATSRNQIEKLSVEQRNISFLSIHPLREYEIEEYLRKEHQQVEHTLDLITSSGLISAASNPFLLSLISKFAKNNTDNSSNNWPRSRAQVLLNSWKSELEKKYTAIGLTDEALLSCVALISFIFKEHEQHEEQIPISNIRELLNKVWFDHPNLVDEAVSHFCDYHLVETYEDESYRLVHDSLIEVGIAQILIKNNPSSFPLIALERDKSDTLIGDWVALHPDPDQAASIAIVKCNEYFSGDILVDIITAASGVLSEKTLDDLWTAIGSSFSSGLNSGYKTGLALQTMPVNLIKQGVRHGLLREYNKKLPKLAPLVKEALFEGWFTALLPRKLYRKNKRELSNNTYSSNSKPNTVNYSVAALEKALLNDLDYKIRASSAYKLAIVGNFSIVPALEKALFDDISQAVRGTCAYTLGQIGYKGSLQALQKALLTDSENDVRGTCANALGNIGDKSSVFALEKTLINDPDHSVRGSSANALGNIGDKNAVYVLEKALVKDPDPSVRGSSANALGNIGDKSAVSALKRALRNDQEFCVQGSCANALGNISDKIAISALTITLLDLDQGSTVRGSCANALGNIGDMSAIPALVNALSKDPNSIVRGSSAHALGSIGDKSAVPALGYSLLNDIDLIVRGSSANALGKIRDISAASVLVTKFHSDSAYKVRISCANALGIIGDKNTVSALSEALLNDPSTAIRRSCAHALGNIGDKSAAEGLKNSLLRDKNETVRGACTISLSKLSLLTEDSKMKISDTLEKVFFSDLTSDRLCSRIATAHSKLNSNLDSQLYQNINKRRSDGSFPNKLLRGKIVELVSNNNEDCASHEWLTNEVIFKDPNPINRTNAIKGLDKANKLSPKIIRYLLDPGTPGYHGKSRDTDRGVLGVTANAVIKNYFRYSNDEEYQLLLLATNLFTEEETHQSVIAPTFSSLWRCSLTDAEQIMKVLEHLTRNNKNYFFGNSLKRNKSYLLYRRAIENSFEEIKSTAPKLLNVYRKKVEPKIRQYLELDERDTVSFEPKIAVITVTDLEHRVFFDYAESLKLHIVSKLFENRYYREIQVTENNNNNNSKFILIQPTDKGTAAAQSLVNFLLRTFNLNYIIMTGVCAGFPDRGVKIGDVVIAKQIFNYERARLTKGQYRTQPQAHHCNSQLINLSKFLKSQGEFDQHLQHTSGKVHIKDYACGDKVIADENAEVRKKILEISDDIIALEMEGSAMLHSVWENSRIEQSTGAIMVKAVSDLGDNEMTKNKDIKQQYAMLSAAKVTLSLIQNIEV